MAAVRLAEFMLTLVVLSCVVLVLGTIAVRAWSALRWRIREDERAEYEFADKFHHNESKP